MILVGLNLRRQNCQGYGESFKTFFTCDDYHQAATRVLKHGWSNGFWVQYFLSGEFHDTDSHKTWSVDAGGHTKKDYRYENDEKFIAKWKGIYYGKQRTTRQNSATYSAT